MKKNTNTNLINGIGINDADYVVESSAGGIKWRCPYYQVWSRMTRRVNGTRTIFEPMFGYDGVLLHEDWKHFSNFKKWMETKQWEGMELDKDLIFPGNKLYGPETCVFVPPELNKAITKKKKHKSKYMQGVSKRTTRYRAMMNKHGKNTHLGYFDTELEAHIIYSKTKSRYLEDFLGINDDIDDALKKYLKVFNNYIQRMESKCLLNTQT